MTTSTTHQKIPVFLRRHIFSFLPIFEDERNWLDDKWLRPFRVAVKGEEVDRGKQRRKKRCCRITGNLLAKPHTYAYNFVDAVCFLFCVHSL